MLDAEIVSRWVYERTFCSLQWPPGPGELLARLVGSDRVQMADEPFRCDRSADGFRVTIQRGHNEQLCLQFATASAIVARLLRREPPGTDDQIRRIAAAIVMPKPALRRTLRAIGPRMEDIARAFVVPVETARDRICALGFRLASGEYRPPAFRSVG